MKRYKIFLLISLLSMSCHAQMISPTELGDSLTKWCGFPSCVPKMKVRNIHQKGNNITVKCGKLISGKSMTAEEIRELKRLVSIWTTGWEGAKVKILTDGYELDELAVRKTGGMDLSGKRIALWASHGRYYNRKEERWCWQRARMFGTVEDLLTTEYTERLRKLLEAAGAEVVMPRPSPESEEGRKIGESGLPRWMEAATYWLRDQGYPEEVWAPKGKEEDYRNDILCRPLWVNYLNEVEGKKIDLCLAIHTDGYDEPGDDKTVGTLVIYYDRNEEGKRTLRDGRNRMRVNRQLGYQIQQSIVHTMRDSLGIDWAERQLENANYGEARVPNVPTLLLEIGSHKDISDAQYLLDPHSIDLVTEAIVRGLSPYANNHLSPRRGTGCQIQRVRAGDVEIVNAFTRICGPEFYFDSLRAGVVPGRWGIPDSVSYSLLGAQSDYERCHTWQSDDESGWGDSDMRWMGHVCIGNTHDYHQRHAAVVKTASQTDHGEDERSATALMDIILGQELGIPASLQDSITQRTKRGLPTIVSGAYIGRGPMVKETKLQNCKTTQRYVLETEPNDRVLYCNESRALKVQKGDSVLYRWSESGLPAIIRRNHTIFIGTMLESIVDWEELYNELINTLYGKEEKPAVAAGY